MLTNEQALEVLRCVNAGSPPQAQFIEGDYIDQLNCGMFGPRDRLTQRDLLIALIRLAFTRVMPDESLPEPLTLIPTAPQGAQTPRYRLTQARDPEFDLLYGRDALPFDDAVYDSTLLTMSPLPREVTFTGEQLFYEFRALDLHYTLRDGRFRFLRHATKEEDHAQNQRWYDKIQKVTSDRTPTADEIAAWSNRPPQSLSEVRQRLDRQRLVTLFPSPQDQKKIAAFLRDYGGPHFLPDHEIDVSIGDNPLQYFTAVNRAWQTFNEQARLLLDQAIPTSSPQAPRTDGPWDSVDCALDTIASILAQTRPLLFRQGDGTFGEARGPLCGLYWCYLVLWEKCRGAQPSSRCALPTCQIPFHPRRKDQKCCCPTHSKRHRQLKRRRKNHPQHLR